MNFQKVRSNNGPFSFFSHLYFIQRLKNFLFLWVFLCSFQTWAQVNISGTIKDSSGYPMEGVRIFSPTGAECWSSDEGKYEISIQSKGRITLQATFMGNTWKKVFDSLPAGSLVEFDWLIDGGEALRDLKFKVDPNRHEGIIGIDLGKIKRLPNPSGNFESILKTLGPVASNNELSSQYNVRGGNFDENLVYVNEIEVYRPQLVRAGQQEGLSFIHTDLVQKVKFSAGGFEAKYGDKMSSVLDVTYRNPENKQINVNANFMGIISAYENRSANKKWTVLGGLRYRNNAYLLNSLDVTGSYRPVFFDFQTLIGYQANARTKIQLLLSHARNSYINLPINRTTSFGTVTNALQLYVGFEGREQMNYATSMAGLSIIQDVNSKVRLRWIISGYQTTEQEFFDVIGGYRLSDLDNDLGSETFGKVKSLRGLGVFWNHARNELNALVASAGHRGTYYLSKGNLQWGASVQQESIQDKLKEWNIRDSADYMTPFIPGKDLTLLNYLNSSTQLTNQRLQAYVQHMLRFSGESNFALTYGVRYHYAHLNRQHMLSPRFQLSFEPNRRYNLQHFNISKKKKDILIRVQGGVYYQPPFYREMRDAYGVVNTQVKAQQSIHAVTGMDYQFKAWGRPFKWTTEAYYKRYLDLIPYDIDNVKIRYFAKNSAHGYAAGLDTRINGEFVPGLESWASLSIMKVGENLDNDQFTAYRNIYGRVIRLIDTTEEEYTPVDTLLNYDPGFIPRPTDQRFNFSVFFQDELPGFPTYKMALNLVVGGGLPFGPPENLKFRNYFRVPPYRRVDIGFTKIIFDEKVRPKRQNGKMFKALWLSLEVFNVLQFNNTVSVFWVKDITNRQFAVPNYLTSRRINFQINARF